MKSWLLMLSLVASSLLKVDTAFAQDPWINRPNVIVAAERLVSEIGQLDTALHDAKAPSHVVSAAHHFETTTDKFNTSVKENCTFASASAQFRHIHHDLHHLESEFDQHHYLLHIPAVATEWRHVRVAYNNLDLEMYHFDEARWPLDKAQSVRQAVMALDLEHR